MITAVAFIPEDHPLDGVYARRCLDHMDQNGYRLRAIIRTWDQLDRVVRAGTAEVIVFARKEHFYRLWRPRIEFVAQSSQEPHRRDLARHIAGRHRRGFLERLTVSGAARVVFPASEYGSARPGDGERNARRSAYETARLMPRGDDGGFAERFLRDRREPR